MSRFCLAAIAAGLFFTVLFAWAGTNPAASASQYSAHLQRDGVGIGARLLKPDQVQHEIAADLKRCCLVIEIAIYPATAQAMAISTDDFLLHTSTSTETFKPARARLIAAILEKESAPPRDLKTSGEVGVGYETSAGRDPYGNPQRVSGVSKEAQIGVGVGGSAGPPLPPNSDRAAMERELSGKSLPEGSVANPVAGYLYFPLSLRKQKKQSVYQLEYTLNGQKLILPLPQP